MKEKVQMQEKIYSRKNHLHIMRSELLRSRQAILQHERSDEANLPYSLPKKKIQIEKKKKKKCLNLLSQEDRMVECGWYEEGLSCTLE